MLSRHKDAFAYSNADITGYTGEQGPFEIPLTDEGSTKEKPRRLSGKEQEIVDEYYEAPGAGSSDCPSTSRQISEESLISCKCACVIATESLILTHFYNFVGEGSTLYGFSVPLGSKTSLI